MTKKPKITYFGQSCFYIETSDANILLDPQNKKSGNLEGDLIYCTHKHFDHIGGVATFLGQNEDAILVGNEQVTSSFPKFGDRAKTVKDGGTFEFKSITLSFTKLRHGIFKGMNNLAVEIQIGDFTFAHCGDAVSFDGFPTSSVNVLAVPIGGAFVASPKKALSLIQSLSEPLPIVVPMHWLIRSPAGFCKKLKATVPNANCVVPVKGECLVGFE
ncbi:MAG: MBL fold metallo-hydrolase [Candidatus Thorarchaeota archaeon]